MSDAARRRRRHHPRPPRQRRSAALEALGDRCSSSWRSRSSSSTASPRPISSTRGILSDATFNFTEKAMIAFAMALLIIAGEIDLSVAAIIALASTAMGAAAAGRRRHAGAGRHRPRRRARRCGAFNGFARHALPACPSIVVTIGTMSLFRGIAYIVLGDQAYSSYPAELRLLRPGLRLVGRSRSSSCSSSSLAVVFGIVLHRTVFGRRVYAIGNNPVAAQFSGVRVDRIKLHPVLPDRADVRHRRGAAHLAARLDPADDRHRLRARSRHHGGARRRQHPRRLRHDPRRRHRRLHHGAGHLRLRPAQRARHRHVDLHRPAADRRHRAADRLAAVCPRRTPHDARNTPSG